MERERQEFWQREVVVPGVSGPEPCFQPVQASLQGLKEEEKAQENRSRAVSKTCRVRERPKGPCPQCQKKWYNISLDVCERVGKEANIVNYLRECGIKLANNQESKRRNGHRATQHRKTSVNMFQRSSLKAFNCQETKRKAALGTPWFRASRSLSLWRCHPPDTVVCAVLCLCSLVLPERLRYIFKTTSGGRPPIAVSILSAPCLEK